MAGCSNESTADADGGGGGQGGGADSTSANGTPAAGTGSGGRATNGAGGNASTSSTATGSTGSGVGPGSAPTVGGCQVFPSDNAWNTDISQLPVRANSDAIIDSIGRAKHSHPDFGSTFGIPYVVVDSTQPTVPVAFDYDTESDPGPYPIPPSAPVEEDSDSHILVVNSNNCMLYELWQASTPNGGVSWQAGSGAIWDMNINDTRPLGWTSADAAGLAILPGLARYEEIVTEGVIRHALRFTVMNSRAAYVPPASHWAASDTNPDLPAMGERLRMKASFDCSGFSSEAQVVCTALKTYGMILADNGADWYISGAPNPAFDDDALGDIKLWTGDAFEVVDTGEAVTD
jgi:hypothetical protein